MQRGTSGGGGGGSSEEAAASHCVVKILARVVETGNLEWFISETPCESQRVGKRSPAAPGFLDGRGTWTSQIGISDLRKGNSGGCKGAC